MALDASALKAISESLNLSGEALLNYLSTQQEKEREERVLDRELKAKELENRAAERALERERITAGSSGSNPERIPQRDEIRETPRIKLPLLKDGDDLTAYLTRFERVAALYN